MASGQRSKIGAAESTRPPSFVSEAALAHVVADKVEAAYRRSDLLEKRRKLMEAWAAYRERNPISAEVVPLRRRAIASDHKAGASQ